jgi:hypothetical protein
MCACLRAITHYRDGEHHSDHVIPGCVIHLGMISVIFGDVHCLGGPRVGHGHLERCVDQKMTMKNPLSAGWDPDHRHRVTGLHELS